jgi:flavorubredoxin
MQIVERATASLDSADLEELIEEVVKAKGFKITSGLNNSPLTGIELHLELIKLTPDEKKALAQRGNQVKKVGSGAGGGSRGLDKNSNKKEKGEVAALGERPL